MHPGTCRSYYHYVINYDLFITVTKYYHVIIYNIIKTIIILSKIIKIIKITFILLIRMIRMITYIKTIKITKIFKKSKNLGYS